MSWVYFVRNKTDFWVYCVRNKSFLIWYFLRNRTLQILLKGSVCHPLSHWSDHHLFSQAVICCLLNAFYMDVHIFHQHTCVTLSFANRVPTQSLLLRSLFGPGINPGFRSHFYRPIILGQCHLPHK